MRIVSIRHKALERLWKRNATKGLPPDQVKRLRAALTLLSSAPNLQALGTAPGWRLLRLQGDRAGIWSMTITANWRLTFRVGGMAVHDVDLEDYH